MIHTTDHLIGTYDHDPRCPVRGRTIRATFEGALCVWGWTPARNSRPLGAVTLDGAVAALGNPEHVELADLFAPNEERAAALARVGALRARFGLV